MATVVAQAPEESCFQGVVLKWAGHQASVVTSSVREAALSPLQQAAQVRVVAAARVVAGAVASEGQELLWAQGA